ncbi:hypothetical protein T492DRAFT_1152245 [Pavlovales sp. CCMP2436]|nr:hypothetical protein T492DRAFT_1152245 [Pavlovales sp. CCMP2436]
MQALPAAQAVSHYRASLAKRPQTHGVDTPEYQVILLLLLLLLLKDWYKACPQTHDKTSDTYHVILLLLLQLLLKDDDDAAAVWCTNIFVPLPLLNQDWYKACPQTHDMTSA